MAVGDEKIPENFLVAARVRNYVAEKGLKLSDDVIDELNRQVRRLVDEAIIRTQANKRLTVRRHDL